MSAVTVVLACLTLGAQSTSAALTQLQVSRRAIIDADLHGDWAALVEARDGVLRLSGRTELRGLVEYEAGYADWRLSSLAYLGAGKEVQMTLLLRSAGELQAATAARPDLADAHALLAWVAASALGTDAEKAAPLAPLIQPAWKAAAPAIASNPRVALLRAMSTYFSPPAYGGSRVRGLAQWASAIGLFEQRTPGAPELPTWGHAEALAWLGGAHLGAGDPGEAARWLERALAVRPDFWWVRTVALPQARRPVLPSGGPAAPQEAPDG